MGKSPFLYVSFFPLYFMCSKHPTVICIWFVISQLESAQRLLQIQAVSSKRAYFKWCHPGKPVPSNYSRHNQFPCYRHQTNPLQE